MPTALGRRSGAVYGEKSPKTRLVRIYCYGSTLYVVNLPAQGVMFPVSPGSNLGGDGFFFVFVFLNSLFFLFAFFFHLRI